jgi:hypothetical protein
VDENGRITWETWDGKIKMYREMNGDQETGKWAVEEFNAETNGFDRWDIAFTQLKRAKNFVAKKLEEKREQMAREAEERWERERPLVYQKRSIEGVHEYFQGVMDDLDRLKQEVQNYYNRFFEEHEVEHYADALNNIEWCQHRVQQFQGRGEQAVRKATRYAAAYQLELF